MAVKVKGRTQIAKLERSFPGQKDVFGLAVEVHQPLRVDVLQACRSQAQ
jgi:hypothetical protein